MTDTDLQTLTDARRELPDTDRSWSANLMRLAYAEIQFARAAEAMAEGFRSIGAVNVTVDDPEAGRRSSLAAYEELARGGHAGARRIVERMRR